VQRVVDAHDGVVWVQRAREGGAAFHLVLPLTALSSSSNATLVA
jgi:signal transduction histidine kinase